MERLSSPPAAGERWRSRSIQGLGRRQYPQTGRPFSPLPSLLLLPPPLSCGRVFRDPLTTTVMRRMSAPRNRDRATTPNGSIRTTARQRRRAWQRRVDTSMGSDCARTSARRVGKADCVDVSTRREGGGGAKRLRPYVSAQVGGGVGRPWSRGLLGARPLPRARARARARPTFKARRAPRARDGAAICGRQRFLCQSGHDGAHGGR